eukprot:scaffold8944_cov36-Phaeocystis_antarctica.AAC.3
MPTALARSSHPPPCVPRRCRQRAWRASLQARPVGRKRGDRRRPYRSRRPCGDARRGRRSC